jgi:hypothetical protein
LIKETNIDGITYEHLKYGGKLLEKHLCNFFNMIFDKCVTPNVWKASMIIPLHKGGSKPKTDCDAYRGMSLISCVCKVFEKLLDCRIDERLNNFPTDNTKIKEFNFKAVVTHSIKSIHTVEKCYNNS